MNAANNNAELIALALGSNLGDRMKSLRAAVSAVSTYFTIAATSAVYETPPAYVVEQPAFLNAVIVGTTYYPPLDLLRYLKENERHLGRKTSFRNGPRLIDIDIVFYGERRMETSELQLPHPRLAEREFVLRPLADVAPDWRHPVTGQTVSAMLEALPETTAKRIVENL